MSDEDGSVGKSRIRARIPFLAMAGALTASYGTLLGYMGRFLYPAKGRPADWVYIGQLKRWKNGETRLFKAPSGETVNISRSATSGDASDFSARSSVCPHLGCQVHWEPHNDRYFCPCHNGVFASDGTAVSGPPADSGQSLPSYPLRVVKGLLYIEVPTDKLELAAEPRGRRGSMLSQSNQPAGAGHDPCLAAAFGQGAFGSEDSGESA